MTLEWNAMKCHIYSDGFETEDESGNCMQKEWTKTDWQKESIERRQIRQDQQEEPKKKDKFVDIDILVQLREAKYLELTGLTLMKEEEEYEKNASRKVCSAIFHFGI